MLDIGKESGSRPKCYFTVTALPTFINHEQPSTKRKPFSTVLEQTFSHRLDVLLPENAANNLRQALANDKGILRYARVNMKLGEIIQGDFFNQYIKTGNILMLSQGRPGVDHVFSLSDGILHLEVDKSSYERMGLEGKAIPSGGRKHVKARFAIDINLRLPAMVHGKKGFERVVRAFSNVLNNSITWLFHDLKAPNDGTGPLSARQPVLRAVEPETSRLEDVFLPINSRDGNQDDPMDAAELLEWVSLALNQTPRLQEKDTIDPYLCRYRNPYAPAESDDGSSATAQNLVCFRWQGFASSAFVTRILLAVMKAAGNEWFAISAAGFDGHAYTIFKMDERTFIWEYVD